MIHFKKKLINTAMHDNIEILLIPNVCAQFQRDLLLKKNK